MRREAVTAAPAPEPDVGGPAPRSRAPPSRRLGGLSVAAVSLRGGGVGRARGRGGWCAELAVEAPPQAASDQGEAEGAREQASVDRHGAGSFRGGRAVLRADPRTPSQPGHRTRGWFGRSTLRWSRPAGRSTAVRRSGPEAPWTPSRASAMIARPFRMHRIYAFRPVAGRPPRRRAAGGSAGGGAGAGVGRRDRGRGRALREPARSRAAPRARTASRGQPPRAPCGRTFRTRSGTTGSGSSATASTTSRTSSRSSSSPTRSARACPRPTSSGSTSRRTSPA